MINLVSINTSIKSTPTSHLLTINNHWDHFLARIGYKRNQHRVEPGLYSLGNPKPDSPVFVTANYTLSFDALRSNLKGIDCHILVLDTFGVNVWCAAGKKTFGTEELVFRIIATQLKKVVDRHVLILPQLGAPGISAHEVKKRTGFKVEYGPVRAAEIPKYLKLNKATPEMRKVNFTLMDRLILIPVDLVHFLLPTLLIAAIAWFLLDGLLGALAVLAVLFSGAILFPLLLPFLPSRNFSTKGFFLGFVTALPFVLISLIHMTSQTWIHQTVQALAFLLVIPPPIAYIALNFTGATTFTSKTGVQREMTRYLPKMIWLFGIGLLILVTTIFVQ